MKSSTRYTAVAIATLAVTAGVFWCLRNPAGDAAMKGEQGITVTEGIKRQAVPKQIRDFRHPQVKTLTSKEALGFAVRLSAVGKLPDNLSPEDLASVMAFMNAPQPVEMQAAEWHAVVDALINVLRRQELAPEGLTDALIHLYHHGADSVLKDYAIQYLRYWFVDREIRYKHETRPEKREQILATLVDAAHKLAESYSGTALMALDHVTTDKRLAAEPETQALIQNQLKDFNRLLIQAVSSSETNKLCRVSAIQVAAIREVSEILPVVRTLAADPTADPNIRISAIAAIGQLGDLSEDKELLIRLEKSGQRLAYAAAPALHKLSTTP